MIWLVGNKGLLGTELSMLLAERGIPFTGTGREVDILDPPSLESFAAGKDLTWVINCAAYTAVDMAEDEEALALRLNAEGPENLARLCARTGSRLLHVSTDYVFDGSGGKPYLETDPVSPAGAYGRTKAEGERRLMAEAPGSVIVRTAWLYGKHGPNFVHTMLRLMNIRDDLGVVADQRGSPTWAFDLSNAIATIVSRSAFPAGIYHYTNDGETTWHDFALEIQRQGNEHGLLERGCRIKPLTSAEYPTKARRPAYSVLSTEKVRASAIPVPRWQESLKAFFDCGTGPVINGKEND